MVKVLVMPTWEPHPICLPLAKTGVRRASGVQVMLVADRNLPGDVSLQSCLGNDVCETLWKNFLLVHLSFVLLIKEGYLELQS